MTTFALAIIIMIIIYLSCY